MYNADKPIKTSGEDLLGRRDFSEQLAEAVVKLSSTDTFVVGLYGKWGSGKTSVVNMTEEILRQLSGKNENSKVTLIRFNPWGYTDGYQLIQQFFSVLSNEIQSDTSGNKKKVIGDALEKYSFVLNYLQYIPVVGPFLSGVPELAEKIGTQLKDGILSNENNVQYQKEVVKKALSSFHRKIVIFIDDIDRLPNDQIRMIFQLVNSVADFPNTTYLLSFDHEIVCRALSSEQSCKGEEYLEKIIQVPFYLPDISRVKIKEILLAKTEEIFNGTSSELITEKHFEEILYFCIYPYVNSLRDLYRFTNVLSFKYSPLKGFVNPVDMAGITAVEIFNTPLHSFIKDNLDYLTDKDRLENLYRRTNTAKREDYWIDKISKLYPDNPRFKLAILEHLFPVFAASIGNRAEEIIDKEMHRTLRIGHKEYANRYFTLQPGHSLLSFNSMNRSHQEMTAQELSEYVHTIIGYNLIEVYLTNLMVSTSYLSAERAALLFSVLFDSLCIMPLNVLVIANNSKYPLCYELLLILIKIIPDQRDRQILLINTIDIVSVESIVASIPLLFKFEFEHGMFSSEPIENKNQILSNASLRKIEKSYSSILSKINDFSVFFRANNFPIMYMVLKHLFSVNYNAFMSRILSSDDCIAMYVASVTNEEIQSNNEVVFSFNLKDDFKEFMPISRVVQYVELIVSNGSFFDSSQDIQDKLCALISVAKSTGKASKKFISRSEVRIIIKKWTNPK